MTDVKSVCVFCGSREGADPAFREATIRLGLLLAERGVRLVYGGGSIGLMGVLADTVLAAGGTVVGVIPDFLVKYEISHKHVSEMVITGSMHDRKRRMFELSDAFVVLPGGLGTLDETFEIITWKQIRLHDAPIVVLDIAGCWSPLRAVVDLVIANGFAHPRVADLFTVVTSPDDVLPALETAPPPHEAVLTSHL